MCICRCVNFSAIFLSFRCFLSISATVGTQRRPCVVLNLFIYLFICLLTFLVYSLFARTPANQSIACVSGRPRHTNGFAPHTRSIRDGTQTAPLVTRYRNIRFSAARQVYLLLLLIFAAILLNRFHVWSRFLCFVCNSQMDGTLPFCFCFFSVFGNCVQTMSEKRPPNAPHRNHIRWKILLYFGFCPWPWRVVIHKKKQYFCATV